VAPRLSGQCAASSGLSAGAEFSVPMPKIELIANENGPNLVMIDGKVAVALCRCGHSEHKPQCDGSHRTSGFRAPKAVVTLPETSAGGAGA
jgi:CDGSH-type Zn-finger protein